MRGQMGPTDETQFELKYCERCGGLGVRRMVEEQIYCLACAREVAELPPVSHEAEDSSHEARWIQEGEWVEPCEMHILDREEEAWGE